jgi:hypothetical protein
LQHLLKERDNKYGLQQEAADVADDVVEELQYQQQEMREGGMTEPGDMKEDYVAEAMLDEDESSSCQGGGAAEDDEEGLGLFLYIVAAVVVSQRRALMDYCTDSDDVLKHFQSVKFDAYDVVAQAKLLRSKLKGGQVV